MITWLRHILKEASVSVDWEPADKQLMTSHDPFDMGISVIKIWSHIFQGNSPWPITKVVGKSLALYADIYEKSR